MAGDWLSHEHVEMYSLDGSCLKADLVLWPSFMDCPPESLLEVSLGVEDGRVPDSRTITSGIAFASSIPSANTVTAATASLPARPRGRARA